MKVGIKSKVYCTSDYYYLNEKGEWERDNNNLQLFSEEVASQLVYCLNEKNEQTEYSVFYVDIVKQKVTLTEEVKDSIKKEAYINDNCFYAKSYGNNSKFHMSTFKKVLKIENGYLYGIGLWGILYVIDMKEITVIPKILKRGYEDSLMSIDYYNRVNL